MVVCEDRTVEADRSVFFTSGRLAVRAGCRVGFGFPYGVAVAKVTTA